MGKASPAMPADKLLLYEKLVATNPEVERKGAAVPYTSLNGHMFSYLNANGTMALRLPAGEREAFLAKYRTRLFEAYGIVQKEYVEVPEALLRKTAELKKFFDISYAYVASLKPKPTTRKKSGAGKAAETRPAAKKAATRKSATKKSAARKKSAASSRSSSPSARADHAGQDVE